MAAAPKAQGPPRLVPVHEDVQPYTYSSSYIALGGGLDLGAGSSAAGGKGAGSSAPPTLVVIEERRQSSAQEPAAERPLLEDALDDFISLDVEPAVPQRGEQPPAAAAAAGGGGSGGVADALLGDYVALGILDDPAAAAAEKAAATVRQSARPELLPSVPWMAALKGIRSPLLRLHQEVVEFCRYLAPSPAESAARQAAIDAIEDVVTSIWPKARLQVFGSFATGLYLPTSDVDAVIMGSGCTDVPQGLKALATALTRRSMAKSMQVIAKAKVPIVKFEDASTGYNFDVSFDVANGPEAAANVRALMDSLPPMRPLVMVLKVFLQQRELNEVYSGGLGSYALLVMVAAFLQLHPSRLPPASAQRYGSSKAAGRAGELEGSLGVLLVDFLRLYGRALNNMEVGVSCRKGGSFFSKRNKGFFQPDRPFLFAVEDPNDPDNDLGRNSYNISRVRMAFDWAYCQLTAPSDPGASLLQRIIRLDPVLFLRAPPPYPDDDAGRAAGKKRKKTGKELEEEGGGSGRARRGGTPDEGGRGGRDGGDEGRRRRHKRRRRERSLSDSDEADAAEAPTEEESGEEEGEHQRRRHGKHHKHHKHSRHSRQHRHESFTKRGRPSPPSHGRQRHERHHSRSRHVYFDD